MLESVKLETVNCGKGEKTEIIYGLVVVCKKIPVVSVPIQSIGEEGDKVRQTLSPSLPRHGLLFDSPRATIQHYICHRFR